jgi:hypothetical protein
MYRMTVTIDDYRMTVTIDDYRMTVTIDDYRMTVTIDDYQLRHYAASVFSSNNNIHNVTPTP